MAFKSGDVVVLKSGGPKMTVESTGPTASGQESVWCVWFEGMKQKNGVFAIEAVKLADEK